MGKEIRVYKVKNYQPPSRQGVKVDRFDFGGLKKEGDTNAVPLDKHNVHTLRALINRHRKHWQKTTGNAYSVHYEEVGEHGKETYYIRLEKTKK